MKKDIVYIDVKKDVRNGVELLLLINFWEDLGSDVKLINDDENSEDVWLRNGFINNERIESYE